MKKILILAFALFAFSPIIFAQDKLLNVDDIFSPDPKVFTPCSCSFDESLISGVSPAGWQLMQRGEKNTFEASLNAARAFAGSSTPALT